MEKCKNRVRRISEDQGPDINKLVEVASWLAGCSHTLSPRFIGLNTNRLEKSGQEESIPLFTLNNH